MLPRTPKQAAQEEKGKKTPKQSEVMKFAQAACCCVGVFGTYGLQIWQMYIMYLYVYVSAPNLGAQGLSP